MGDRFLQRVLLVALAWPAVAATEIVDSQGKIIDAFHRNRGQTPVTANILACRESAV